MGLKEEQMNFITSSDKRMPIGKPRLYNWYRENKYPELIVKVGGKILFDLDLWEKMIQEQIEKNIELAKRTQSEKEKQAYEKWRTRKKKSKKK